MVECAVSSFFVLSPKKNVQANNHDSRSQYTAQDTFGVSNIRFHNLALILYENTAASWEKYLPRCSGVCKRGTSNKPESIWTSGLNAEVKTGPRFLTHQAIPTKHSPDPTIPCHQKNKAKWLHFVIYQCVNYQKDYLTEYSTDRISTLPFKTHTEECLVKIKQMAADWMAPKNDIIAVLEYWHGNIFPIWVWSKYHDDHKTVPATKATRPNVHLLDLSVEVKLKWAVWVATCEWSWLNRGTPL